MLSLKLGMAHQHKHPPARWTFAKLSYVGVRYIVFTVDPPRTYPYTVFSCCAGSGARKAEENERPKAEMLRWPSHRQSASPPAITKGFGRRSRNTRTTCKGRNKPGMCLKINRIASSRPCQGFRTDSESKPTITKGSGRRVRNARATWKGGSEQTRNVT